MGDATPARPCGTGAGAACRACRGRPRRPRCGSSRSARSCASAGCASGDDLARPAVLVSGTSAVGISQRPSVVWNRSSANFGSWPVPIHGRVVHQQRHRHFLVAMLARVQVDHELAERALQPRQRRRAARRTGCRPAWRRRRNPSGPAPRPARNAASAGSRNRAARRAAPARRWRFRRRRRARRDRAMLGSASSAARIAPSSSAARASSCSMSPRSAGRLGFQRGGVGTWPACPGRSPWPARCAAPASPAGRSVRRGARRPAPGPPRPRPAVRAAPGRRRTPAGSARMARMSCIVVRPRPASARPCAPR